MVKIGPTVFRNPKMQIGDPQSQLDIRGDYRRLISNGGDPYGRIVVQLVRYSCESTVKVGGLSLIFLNVL